MTKIRLPRKLKKFLRSDRAFQDWTSARYRENLLVHRLLRWEDRRHRAVLATSPTSSLAFHPKAFEMTWEGPTVWVDVRRVARYEILYGTGTVRPVFDIRTDSA